DVEVLHRPRQQLPGRPQLAEQRPLRRGDAQALAVPVRTPELLAIGEHAQAVVVAADGDVFLAGFVARHVLLPGLGRAGRASQVWKGANRGRKAARDARGSTELAAMVPPGPMNPGPS